LFNDFHFNTMIIKTHLVFKNVNELINKNYILMIF